jgi:hypothetical protein
MPGRTAFKQARRHELPAVAWQADIFRQPGEDFVKGRDNVSRMFDFAAWTETNAPTAARSGSSRPEPWHQRCPRPFVEVRHAQTVQAPYSV